MKYLIAAFTLILSLSACKQADKFSGTYQEKREQPSGETLKIVLELKQDGTFFCTFFQDQLDYKDNDKGKGQWAIKNNEIWFSARPEKDVNIEYTMNFNGTKARVEGKKLIFFESEM